MNILRVIVSIGLLLTVAGTYSVTRKAANAETISRVCDFEAGQVVTLKTGHKAVVTRTWPTSNVRNQCRVHIYSYGVVTGFPNNRLLLMLEKKDD